MTDTSTVPRKSDDSSAAGRRPLVDQALADELLGKAQAEGVELRVLPLLSTHLSFPEIGAELFLSRNTIKSTVHSIYRKLGASSRSQAVSRSRERGLLAG
jgi:LuxR family transcriptional regulator, maltose regulon positive regulatory protein